MNILFAYGTTEGQTKKIAHHVEATLKSDGHSCTTHSCDETRDVPDVATFDAVIIAGSVHQKRHQPEITAFIEGQHAALASKPGAFISVSLSITDPDGKAEAQQYVDDFVTETGWTPTATHLAAGAVRFLEYDFFKEFTVKQIVMRGQTVPDKSAGNPEYTDWDALDSFVRSFLDDAVAQLA